MPNSKIEDFKDSLGIGFPGDFEGEDYVINLDNSNDYQIVFNLLDDNDSIELDEDNVIYDFDTNSATFYTNTYELDLVAKFEDEVYTLTIKERN